MKINVLLTALLVIVLAGCELRGKPKVATPPAPSPVAAPAPKPPPPPVPLSIPQTNVALPKEQPLDDAALEITPSTAAAEPTPVAAGPPQRQRNRPPVGSTAPAAPPPSAPAVTPEPRETVQEIVPPPENKRLQERAQAHRTEANQILQRLGRRLNNAQQGVVASIKSFVALSEQAEKYNDMRQADALAERAQILAKELQSGK
jgi:hypothetical protein